MASDHNLVKYFLIMLGVNVILGLAQYGVNAYDPTTTIYNTSASPANRMVHYNDYGMGLAVGVNETLWETSDGVEDSGSATFTDNFKTVKRWLNTLDEVIGILGAILRQPYGFLMDIGIPIPIATAFGILWYIVLILLFTSFIKGGDAN